MPDLRKYMLLSTALFMIGATPATAQDAASAGPADGAAVDEGGIADIVVTARRKSEDAQDVPLSITAIAGEQLAKQDIRNVSDLVRNVPGVVLCCQRGEVQFPFVRGVPGVKGYFAEMPAVLDGNAFYFDLQSVQVLKGPQGTLFGTATNGGAILSEPHRPEKDMGGYVMATLGNYARKGLEGVINVPIGDSVQVRAGAMWNKSRGYIHDGANGRRYGNEDYYILRLGVNAEIAPGLENYLVVNYYDSKDDRPSWTPWAANPASNAYDKLVPILEEQKALGRYHLVGTSIEGGNRGTRKLLNIVNHTTVELTDSIKLRNIFGYARVKSFSRFDADGSPLRIFDNNFGPTEAPSADRIISEELQLQGEIGDKFDFTLGTFHQWFRGGTSDKVTYDDLRDSFGILLGKQPITNKTETHAVFAEGTYNLGDDFSGLRLTGGLRYTNDKVRLVQTNSTWIMTAGNTLLDLASIGAVPHRDFDLKNTFNKVTFKAGAQYVFDNRRMAYFTVSRGYSSGGFNTGNPAGLEAFEPESLTNYELGLKADWGSGDFRVRTNAAVFLGKYDNIQVSTTQANCTDPNNAATCSFAVGTFNAAKADVKGAEFELVVSPTRTIELGGFFSYNKNKYTKYFNDPDGPGPLPAVDLSGQAFVYNPKFKTNLFGTVRAPLDELGELSFSMNFSYQSKIHTSSTPSPQFYDMGASWSNLDARIEWDDMMGREGLTASAFVNNITKNKIADGQFGAYRSLGLWSRSVAVPRQFGLRLRYEY